MEASDKLTVKDLAVAMSYTQQQASSTPSTEEVAEKISGATGGVVSQTTLGNSYLRRLIVGAVQSVDGAPETCAQSEQDGWLENMVEGLFGWLGVGNDPEDCDTGHEEGSDIWREDAGLRAGPITTTETASAPEVEPTPEIEVPPIDLTPYEWLIGVYTGCEAMSVSEAELLLTEASLEQLAATLRVGASDFAEPASTALPEADIESDDNNRARPLEWSAPVVSGHISPEASDTAASGAALEDVFQAHLADTMAEEFGTATLEQIRGAITLATSLGRTEVAAHMQARLARANQYALVATLNVEDSGRYAANSDSTFCNVYAYDFVTAMGAYIPRTWWYEGTIAQIQGGATAVTIAEYQARLVAGESVAGLITPIYGETVRELSANGLNDWMQTWGASFGWEQAGSMTAAQEAANAGSVVVVLATGSPGHISVVLAEKGDLTAARDGNGEVFAPLQSQAGAHNVNHDNLSSGEDTDQWWEDYRHTEGAAWINTGSASSPIVSPESLGR